MTFVRVDYEAHLAVLTLDRADRLDAMSNAIDLEFVEALDEIYRNT
jgi:enoyl-CoA hydratase/carnithine racemase